MTEFSDPSRINSQTRAVASAPHPDLSYWRSFLFMTFSAFCFATMVFLVKWADRISAADIGAPEAVLVRSLPMAFVSLFWVLRRKRTRKTTWNRSSSFWIFLRGSVGALTMLCLFYSGLHTPLAVSSLLFNTNIFFLSIFAHLTLGERLSGLRLAAVVGGFLSVGIILSDGLRVALEGAPAEITAPGLFLGLMAGVLGSIAQLSIRKVRHLDPSWAVLSLSVFGCLFPLMSFVFHQPHWPSETLAWVLLLSSSVPAILAQYALTIAMSRAPSMIVVVAQYFGPMFSLLLGILFLSETISAWKLLGGLLVILFGAAIPFLEQRSKQSSTRADRDDGYTAV